MCGVRCIVGTVSSGTPSFFSESATGSSPADYPNDHDEDIEKIRACG